MIKGKQRQNKASKMLKHRRGNKVRKENKVNKHSTRKQKEMNKRNSKYKTIIMKIQQKIATKTREMKLKTIKEIKLKKATRHEKQK